jgi:RimJ/RimL family protein N-acetyltransferase
MVHSIIAEYENVQIRQLEHHDLELLRQWRNDGANSRYISQIGHITPQAQQEWFEQYLKDTDHCLFAINEIEDLNRFVGSVSLYNFRSGICECGKFLVGDPAARGKGVGRLGIILAMYAGFENLRLRAIDAVVHEENVAALTTDQKAGFQIVGRHLYPDGKLEMELLSEKDCFYKKHDFLNMVKITKVPVTE